MLSFDPSAMRSTVQDGSFEHVQLGRGVFAGTVAHVSSQRLRTDWGSYNLQVQAQGDLCRDMLTFGVMLAGQDPWRVFGAPGENGDMLLFPEGGELAITLPAQAQWLTVQVSRERLEAAGVPVAGLRGTSVWRMGALTDDEGALQTLMDLAPRLAPTGMSSPAVGVDPAQCHEQMLTTLLGEWERRRSARGGHARPALQPSERWRVVRRAEAYLEANPEATVRIDNLCREACTSVSTLERVFREVFGVAPRQYLALRRLAGARNDLLNGDPSASVTEVASRWGFCHLGRFAQEYGRLYHERPSETRLRAARA
jgi:AraC family ethanolamine operon transcriptional activator